MQNQIPKNWQKVKLEDGNVLDLLDVITIGLRTTFEKDEDILKRGRTERLFASRFACNIQLVIDRLFKDSGLNADSPYNKHGDDTKRINRRQIEVDLVLHKRGADSANILVVEIETNNNPQGDDIWKLEEMTKKTGEYKYLYGLFLVLGVKDKVGEILEEQWFIDGKAKKNLGMPILSALRGNKYGTAN